MPPRDQIEQRTAPDSSARRARRKIRVHIDNGTRMPPLFWVTPERYAEAAGRHPAVARRLDTTINDDLEDFDHAMQTAEVFIGWRFPIAGLAARAPHLKWMMMLGAGVDHLLPLGQLPPGVVVTTNSGAHVPKAADYGAMALLMLNNRIPLLATAQRTARWDRVFNTPVAGKTVLIVGVGDIGGAVAKSAQRLTMRVLGIRRTGRPHRDVDEMYGPEELDRLLPRVDFVVVTAPLTSATRGLIGKTQLDLLKPEAGLVNMTRSGVVDYEALGDKLTRGELSGAIIDSAPQEPLPSDSPLWHTPNLFITPHVATNDPDQYTARTLDQFFENMRRYLAGQPLLNVVDPAHEY